MAFRTGDIHFTDSKNDTTRAAAASLEPGGFSFSARVRAADQSFAIRMNRKRLAGAEDVHLAELVPASSQYAGRAVSIGG